MSIASCTFDALLDEHLQEIQQFVGNKSYVGSGAINKRCHKLYVTSKDMEKKTFRYGYAPLSNLIRTLDLNQSRSIGEGIVCFGRRDLLNWILTNDKYGTFLGICNVAAYEGRLDILKQTHEKCDKTLRDPSIKLDTPVCYLDDCKQNFAYISNETLEKFCKEKIYLQGCSKEAAKGGKLHVLKWLGDVGCDVLNADSCNAAASGGSLAVVQWLHDNGCNVFNTKVCSEAAGSGNVELVEFLRQNGGSWDESACLSAAMNGQLTVLKWLRAELNCSWNAEICCMLAAENGHLEVLKWLSQNGCEMNEKMFEAAAKGDQPEIFSWLITSEGMYYLSCDFIKCAETAALSGSLEILKICIAIYPEMQVGGIFGSAAEQHHFHILEWLHEGGVKMPDSFCRFALEESSIELLEWLLNHGYKITDETCEFAAMLATCGCVEDLTYIRDSGHVWDKYDEYLGPKIES